MAVSVQSVVKIEAGVPEIMEVLADVDSLVDWSSAHRAVEVREADDEGWPIVVWERVSQYGVTDEMVVRYEWYDGEVSWSLVESGSQKIQNARYVLTDNGDGTTEVVFDLEVDLKIKLPGPVVKKAQKHIADVATTGLRDEVLRRHG
ncbi:cyclase [Dietzia sp. SLG310A2-38A2]|uniref:SRPBCC family protein n=1 Tax=Dietzia sp. SLG310A2-38A2 TaxID=1630643 RepID=UPI0015FAEC57|nr:SRPBCC family protein [Dietzia sp. SLG310A2-38A2]MBB1031973.1 cyclase [Dietzia sp. SLG310A2-38A2]